MHTEAIPEWRTQCTRGVIYYTELTIPRTITVSLSNRLKMAPPSVYAQTRKHTRSTRFVCMSDPNTAVCMQAKNLNHALKIKTCS